MLTNHFCRLTAFLASAVMSCALATSVNAQNTASIRIIIPYAAGSSTDTYARLIGDSLSRKLNRPAIPVNQPGAGGEIGTLQVVRAKPDGSHLLFQAPAVVIIPTIRKKPSYDVRKDLVPITQIVEGNVGVFINPEVPAKTIKELIDYAKANPGKLNYASFGVGSSGHLHAEMFKLMAGVDIRHVPYASGAPAVMAVAKNEAQIVFADSQGSARPLIKDGKLRWIAVGSKQRSPAYPDIPTVNESGLPGYLASHWLGFFAPAGTSAETVQNLNVAINEFLKTPTMQEKLEQEGYRFVGSSATEFKTFIAAEVKKWEHIVTEGRIEAQ